MDLMILRSIFDKFYDLYGFEIETEGRNGNERESDGRSERKK